MSMCVAVEGEGWRSLTLWFHGNMPQSYRRTNNKHSLDWTQSLTFALSVGGTQLVPRVFVMRVKSLSIVEVIFLCKPLANLYCSSV